MRLLRYEILSLDIHVEHAVDVLARDLGDVSEVLHARVTDHDIQRAEIAHHGLEECGHLRLAGDVGLYGQSAHALGTNLRGDFFGCGCGSMIVDCDVCAARGQFDGDCSADAAAGAGDFERMLD